ncbi:hypothetical protein [Salibacterium aidingense]|uniref:hypothetical protein n=1 Tax=Salibacterium aidingense TaxID=384933 RepID=UPI003BBDF6CF
MMDLASYHLSDLLKIEKPFAKNNYQGNLEDQKVFNVKKGSIPVLVSAPHATKHKRNQTVKEQDDFTGSIALLLHELTGCYLIYTTKISGEDPNFIKGGGSYKKKAVELVQSFPITYLLDLHGASKKRTFDIDMGTCYGKTMKKETCNSILSTFRAFELLDVKQNYRFPATNPNTVSHYTHSITGIETVQLEVNEMYRNPQENKDLFLKCLESLKGVVNKLS